MIELLTVQARLKDTVRASALRGDSAFSLIDLAVANPSFTVAKVQRDLNFSSYAGANKVVGQLVDLGILEAIDERAYKRRFYAPAVLDVLVREDAR